jgi:hypothetical protein
MKTRVSPSTAAGKLTNRRSPHAPLRSYILTCLVCLVSLGVSATPAFAEFGLEKFVISAQNENGTPDVQAGSHPFALTTTFVITPPPCTGAGKEFICIPESEVKDARLELPPGLVGNGTATPRCTYQEFIDTEPHEGGDCSSEAAVGVATVYIGKELIHGGTKVEYDAVTEPVYNLVPPPGVAAEFGFIVAKQTPVLLQTSVRTGSDYGLTTSVSNVLQAKWILASKVTIWGVPASHAHDKLRGQCVKTGIGGTTPPESVGFGLREGEDELETPISSNPNLGVPYSEGTCESQGGLVPLLTNPTSCGVSRSASLSVDDWKEPGNFVGAEGTRTRSVALPPLDGCNKLGFSPSLAVTPDKPNASTSSGLAVDVKVPQDAALNPAGSTEADVRNTTVVLPPGVALNPSSANGLEACSATPAALGPAQLGSAGDQIGFKGFEVPPLEPGVSLPTFTPALPGSILANDDVDTGAFAPGENVFQAGVNFCGNASKVGTVRIKTPLLEEELTGAVYLAAQEANPFSSLMALYFIAEAPARGVLVKLPAEVTLCKSVGEDPLKASGEPIPGVTCEAVGQVVTTLENTPDVPFEEFEAHFFGGEQAPLTTPAHCGTYTTNTSFESWSGEVKHPYAPMEITNGPAGGPNGGACPPSSLPFNPGLTGGALNLNAGAFSPFTLTMNRADGEQNMQSVEAKLPPGLAGILTGVELCPEPQANLGECGANSLIGETTVSVGVGGDPYTDTGGKFYLTGPYNGTGGCTVGTSGCAPFGITFAVPAKAGPFDLAHTKSFSPACDCILVRAKIEVNPLTAALTITSNPPGTPDAIPTEIEGIPLEIQHINAVTTRGNFQFNPTSCSKMEVSGTIHSSENGADTIGVPFQVTNCPSLKFTPKFTVSTSGKTSKADGASLTTKVEEPAGALTTQANLTKVKVELPKQLPSRLTTLQKACTDKQFEANPAGCPSESKIGYAVVHTPLIPVPLEGPAIFVSHGGEAFPSLTMVLQGYGVTIDLVGTTFISKSGVTSTTFKTVPDQPFSSFQLTLPEGKYSALAANGNLCAEKLTMPTEFIAQNGAEIHETTAISVAGCAKVKALTRAQKLQKALKSCRSKDHRKAKRAKCEKAARKAYGPLKKSKTKGKKK